MASISELPNVEVLMLNFVQINHFTYQQISVVLQQMYPSVRGLSPASVRRYCTSKGIYKTSRITDADLDHIVTNGISEVGSTYGRKMMKGYLSSKGIIVAENRVGKSLKRVDPENHVYRATVTHFQINPTPYTASYFGHKIHIDQNEKMVMFGVTHVAAIDGYSGKIVSAVLMPIKNCLTIYEHVYVKVLNEFGLWDQLRIDMGREWSLIVFIQDLLASHRSNTSIRPCIPSSSKNNHVIERLWVEVNSRINYPIKRVLIEMTEEGDLQMDDMLHMFCTSWYTIQVANSGMKLFVTSWNNHPLPGRRDGLARGSPNNRMQQNNNAKRLNQSLIPSPTDAVQMYVNSGGNITMESTFGLDPISNDVQKMQIRNQYFLERCPPFQRIFSEVVNGNTTVFKENLLLLIDVTRRLALS